MLTIRPEQMLVFERAAMSSFHKRATPILAEKRPIEAHPLGEEGLERLLVQVQEWLRPFDLDSEIGIVVCAELFLVWGEAFFTDPSTQRLVANRELTREERVALLEGHLPPVEPRGQNA